LHNFKDYSDLFHIICNEFYGTAPNKNIIIHNLTFALINKIADESKMREFSDLYYQLATIQKQIYNHPDQVWTIQKIADQLSISTGYLHSIYQHFFNTTCMTDVINSRIQSASELLLSSNKSINEIAELFGYNNTEHFINQYKEQTGITPGKYRKP
jgi:AraC-like DNA-binding protein